MTFHSTIIIYKISINPLLENDGHTNSLVVCPYVRDIKRVGKNTEKRPLLDTTADDGKRCALYSQGGPYG